MTRPSCSVNCCGTRRTKCQMPSRLKSLPPVMTVPPCYTNVTRFLAAIKAGNAVNSTFIGDYGTEGKVSNVRSRHAPLPGGWNSNASDVLLKVRCAEGAVNKANVGAKRLRDALDPIHFGFMN